MDSEGPEERGRSGRGVEFCCLSYPLVKAGAYLIPLEFGFVAGCIIVLSTTTPTIVAAVDTLPHIFSLVLLILAIITLAWQVIGLATVRIEMSSIYRLYIRLNFLLVLITAATAAIGTVVIATKHKQSTEVCTRIYGNPPLNSSNGVSVPGLDSFAPGEHICNYVMWAQTAAMGGLTLILFLTQVCFCRDRNDKAEDRWADAKWSRICGQTYMCYVQRAYGQKQRNALQQLQEHDEEE